MRLVIFLKGRRGVACLKALLASPFQPAAAVLQDSPATDWFAEASGLLAAAGIPSTSPADPNAPEALEELAAISADVFALCGYGPILKPTLIALPRLCVLNLHGGRLPGMRGSSPMNWALIHGHDSFGISVIRLDQGVDTGDVALQKHFPITPTDTIADLHAKADAAFPGMLLAVLEDIAAGRAAFQPQDPGQAAYYPRRFPEDGLVLFDQLTAEQVHNRVRALTRPYPMAYTYLGGAKVLLARTTPCEPPYFGEPGRIYRMAPPRVLACAKDRCLWLEEATLEDGRPLAEAAARYDRLATVAQAAELVYQGLAGQTEGKQ